jgi:rod shape-determining protein MreC
MRDSRRARLILALLVLTAFTLITLDYRSGGGGPLRRIANDVFGPIERGVSAVARPIGSFFSGLGHLSGYKHDNARLRAEVARLQAQLHLTDAERAELAQMQKLLHLDQISGFRVVSANVSAVGSSLGFEWTATIDVGSHDGVRPDMTVINGDGLVGMTLDVGPQTATVLLAKDPKFTAGARLEGSQQIGRVDGGGRNPMMLTLLDSQAAIPVGARLVTFGDLHNRPFVPEVPIGHVTRVLSTPGALTRTAVVAPYVDFTSIGVVQVVVATTRTVRRDSLLAPSPTPSPAPSTPPPSGPTPGSSPSTAASTRPSASPSRTR